MMKRIAILIPLLLACQVTWGQKPWTFWYWMYGAVTKEGIKADLQAMKDAGLGGCYLMPIRGTDERPEFEGKAQQLSPEFWEMVDYSFSIAQQLRLEMGIHISDGFALAGGPWISAEKSMQKIVFTDTIIDGKTDDVTLRRPEMNAGYYKDIACFALPVSSTDQLWYPEPEVSWSASMQRDEKGVFRSDKGGWLCYDFEHPIVVRSLEIRPSGNNIQSQRMTLLASNDGEHFTEVMQMQPPRQGWQHDNYAFTYSIPATEARFFRLEWSPAGSEPGSEDLDAAKWRPNLKVAGIRFSSLPRISQWEGKAGYVWRVASETTPQTLPNADCFKQKEIRRVLLDGDRLTTSLPKGRWLLLRMGCTSTGHTNATAGGGKGLECDKFSVQAVEKQVSHWFGQFMKRPYADEVVKYLHVDSWECGCQNWNASFANEFRMRHQYNLLPYLPLLAGYPINSAAESERVLRDVRTTISQLIDEVFFATVRNEAHRYGCFLSSESVAPTMMSDGLSHYRYADMPMGEFWLNSPTHDKPNDMLDAISGAHIYGQPVVQAEGFTEVRGVWDEAPVDLKSLLDRQFALGMNKLFFHVFAHNPWTDRRPGMTLDGIGLFFQRDQTWFPEARYLVDYITRCQEILQDRMPVVDIAVYTGDELPSRSLRPDQLTHILPGLMGAERVKAEQTRMANVGEPMAESPVGVKHAAGIVDPATWCNPLNGYQYDCVNSDVLLRLASVENGRICLPGGASYRVLVLPGKTAMNPSAVPLSKELREKVDYFRKQGVVVIDTAYTQADFSAYGLPQDVILPNNMAYIHIPDELDCHRYFLSNQEARPRSITASFRVEQPAAVVVYDPLARKYYHPDAIRQKAGRTEVDFSLPAYGSAFVILTHNVSYSNLHAAHYTDSVAVTGPWQMVFKENGLSFDTDTLFDWSQHSDQRVRYYSGYAEYSAKVSLKNFNGQTAVLRLDGLHDVGHVYVNGIDCGAAWTFPYEVDVTKALRPGKNTVRIQVVNTWANALKGNDEGHPPYDGIWTNAKYRRGDTTLLPAGLLGPVRIYFE